MERTFDRLVRGVAWESCRSMRWRCSPRRSLAPRSSCAQCTTSRRPGPGGVRPRRQTAKEFDDPRNGPQQRPSRPRRGGQARFGPHPRRPDRRLGSDPQGGGRGPGRRPPACPAWSNCIPTTWSAISLPARGQWDPLPAALASDAQLAAAGVTTVLDAVRIGSALNQNDAAAQAARVLADSIEEACRRRPAPRRPRDSRLRCEVAAAGLPRLFGQFARRPARRLVSLIDHTPGQRQYADMELFKRYRSPRATSLSPAFPIRTSRPCSTVDALRAAAHRRAMRGVAAQRGIALTPAPMTRRPSTSPSRSNSVRISEPNHRLAAAAAEPAASSSSSALPTSSAAAASRARSPPPNCSASGCCTSCPPTTCVKPAPSRLPALGRRRDLPRRRRRSWSAATRPARSASPTAARSDRQRADLVQVRPHDRAATERHPRGRRVPVVRSVYRQGPIVS